jgi:hypothetical protein
MKMKAMSDTIASAISASIDGDVSGRFTPLTSDTRTIALRQTARSAVPA